MANTVQIKRHSSNTNTSAPGSLASGEDERIANLLEGLGFKLWHPSLEKTDADGSLEIINGLNEFREHLGGELTITLLRSCGEGFEANEMNREKIKQAIAWLKSRGRSQCN